jgi:predicted RNase H-like nuclease (RuvC/YqgF family)
MKKLFKFLPIIFGLAVALPTQAQMSKKEKKEWKKRTKSLEPEQYKTLLEENQSLKSQVSTLKNQTADFDSKLADKDSQISEYQETISSLRSDLSATRKQLQDASAAPAKPAGINANVGVVFKVQVGAFKNKDLTKFAEDNENFSAETDGDVNKYTLGVFKDYYEADAFKKYLREMGVKDAWIVSFKDGQRVPIKDVLEGII